MQPVEPYTYRKCTAFKERMDIVNKLNELIDSWNNGEPAFVQRFNEIDVSISEVESSLQDQINEITRDWILCDDINQVQTLFDSETKKPKTDLIVEIKVDYQISNYYIPKNLTPTPFRDVRLMGIANPTTAEIEKVRMTDDYFSWLTSGSVDLQWDHSVMEFPVNISGNNTYNSNLSVFTYDKNLANNTYRIYY